MPQKDARCIPCEQTFASKHKRLRAAADGKLLAPVGKFTVGFLGVLVTGAIALMVPFSIGGALFTGAVGAGFAFEWARTPPRKLMAQQKLRRLRGEFLDKRAPKLLARAD